MFSIFLKYSISCISKNEQRIKIGVRIKHISILETFRIYQGKRGCSVYVRTKRLPKSVTNNLNDQGFGMHYRRKYVDCNNTYLKNYRHTYLLRNLRF